MVALHGKTPDRASHVEITFAAADGETRVALLHRPGPDTPATGTLFEDPWFAGHFAFLTRMREAGYLAAAPRLATEEDASVAGRLLAVTVRPWQVMMRGEVSG